MDTGNSLEKKEPATYCANHPERKAFAICMHCRKVMCQECATQWDGINYCSNCLAEQRAIMVKKAPLTGWILLIVVTAILMTILGYVTIWTGCILADML